MGTLNGSNPKNTYSSLLKLESNNISSSYKVVEDGDGNDTGLYLKDSGVKVNALEFESTPSSAASGTVTALVNESGVVKQTTIYTFGQSAKDIYEGFWYLQSSLSPITVNDNNEDLVRCNGATAETTYRPADLNTLYNTSTYKIGASIDQGTAFRINAEITVTPASGWTVATDYIDVGLDTDNDASMDKQIQTFLCPKGASTAQTIIASFDYYVDTNATTNGIGIYIKPVGDNITYESVKLHVVRTHKR